MRNKIIKVLKILGKIIAAPFLFVYYTLDVILVIITSNPITCITWGFFIFMFCITGYGSYMSIQCGIDVFSPGQMIFNICLTIVALFIAVSWNNVNQ